jgi:quinol monooxygenase YgiN
MADEPDHRGVQLGERSLMSVIMTLQVAGDPAKVEEYAAANEERMQEILEAAKGHGLLAHRFYGTDDGKIMVVDEWPDAESFEAFFAEQQEQINPIMEAAGAAGEPEVNFWRRLEAHDEYGWDA